MLYSYSKKQKVSGALSDQSIEHLNDVTAVSGVNLRVRTFDLCASLLATLVELNMQFVYSKELCYGRKRRSSYFLAPRKIAEFQKLLEELFKKKKTG